MKQPLLASIVILLACGVALAGNSKVTICHIPPDDPENFHTITVSSNALNAHLAHGDLLGACFEHCEALCDDGNACTIDACDPETESCLPDHPPVDCDDSDLCTTDSCDPLAGCLYAPIVCEDDDACTENTCFNGECLYPEINCGEFELCDPISGCYDPCGGIICDPIDQCHGVGQCVFPGDCEPGLTLPDGTPCDDGDVNTADDQCTAGSCSGSPVFPCWTQEEMDRIGTLANAGFHTLRHQDYQCPGWRVGETWYIEQQAQGSGIWAGAWYRLDTGQWGCWYTDGINGVQRSFDNLDVPTYEAARDSIIARAAVLNWGTWYTRWSPELGNCGQY